MERNRNSRSKGIRLGRSLRQRPHRTAAMSDRQLQAYQRELPEAERVLAARKKPPPANDLPKSDATTVTLETPATAALGEDGPRGPSPEIAAMDKKLSLLLNEMAWVREEMVTIVDKLPEDAAALKKIVEEATVQEAPPLMGAIGRAISFPFSLGK